MKALYKKMGGEKRNPGCKGKYHKLNFHRNKKNFKNAC